MRKIDSDKYNHLIKDFDSKVESFIESQDIFFTVEFQGYAFITTNEPSNNKVIKLIFSSEKNQYEVITEVLERFNLRDLFKQKEVLGISHGFITRFSPLKMKNGIYNLYIYCYENDNLIGLKDTGMVFEKNYRSFSEHK